MSAPTRQRFERAALTPTEIVDEYKWLASFGTPHGRIAARLGYTVAALDTVLRRAGYTPPPTGPDAVAAAVLEELIASGREFTCTAIPDGSTERSVTVMLQVANKRGRIRSVGKDTFGNTVWQAVAK